MRTCSRRSPSRPDTDLTSPAWRELRFAMRASVRTMILAGLALALGGALPAQACAPSGLVRVAYRNISPGLAAADPAAQRQTLWRHGSRFLRTESDPDPQRGQRVVIVNEPDVWVMNLATGTGEHWIDSDPQQEVHAPIIATPDTPPTIRALEYGCEAEFITTHAPTPRNTVRFGQIDAALHVVEEGGHSVAILMDPRRRAPLLLSYLRQGRPVLVIRYDEHRTNLPMRLDIFVPPRNVKLTEGAPRAVIGP